MKSNDDPNKNDEFNQKNDDSFYDGLNSLLPDDEKISPRENSDDEFQNDDQYSSEFNSDDSDEENNYQTDDSTDYEGEEYADNNEMEELPHRLRPHRKTRHIARNIFRGIFLFFLLMFVLGIGLFAYYAKEAPQVTQSQLQNAGSSTLYTTDGKMLLTLGQEKRNYVRYDEIPQRMKDAVVSIEDKRFYNEPFGIDPVRIVGSIVSNVRGHDISAGGSSITQQLIKLSAFSTSVSDRTLKRKAQEAWLAVHVSREYTKQQILEYYINKVYMNYNIYGIGTAAHYYYGKNLNQLDLSQTALLAGMPNAPTFYNPYITPARAKYRRDLVLQAMLKNKKITQAEYSRAITENIQTGLIYKHNTQSKLRKIDDPYIKEVVDEVREKGFDPYNDNLKITVNINQQAQNELYHLANSGKVPFTNNKMQVAATVVDPNNGHVIAILGGRHLPNVALGLDRAVQTDRSTGSSIKPVWDYAPAIQYKHWPTSKILYDTPYTYAGTNIQLNDWDNQFYGPMTMRYALEQSRNVPAVRTLQDIGINRAAKFAKQVGINVSPSQGLSVAIGANASTLQMAGAYSAFATLGTYHKPEFVSRIQTATGEIHNYDTPGKRVMDESTAYMITDMLKGVITHGSGLKAKDGDLIEAGKTGTVKYSNSELKAHPSYRGTPKDSWFIGYTRSFVMSVWTGYDTLAKGKITGSGQDSAMLLYKAMMDYLMHDKANMDWEKPDSVVTRQFNTGRELFQKGHAPAAPKKKENINRIPQRVIRRYQKNPNMTFDNGNSNRVVIIERRPNNNGQNNNNERQINRNNQNNNSQNENNSDNQQNESNQNQQQNDGG